MKKTRRFLKELAKEYKQLDPVVIIGKDYIKIFGKPEINLNKSYKIETRFDHRICMSAFIIGQVYVGKIIIKDCNSISTSFPSFLKIMKKIGAKYEVKKKN